MTMGVPVPSRRATLHPGPAIGRLLGGMALHGLLALLAVLSILPLWWAFAASLTPSARIFANLVPLSWHAFVPDRSTIEAYVALFRDHGFVRPVLNSSLIAVATIATGLVVNALAGFAFAKFRFPGRDLLFVLVLITFMVPFEAIAIPLYTMMRAFGWINTYWALIVPAVANGLVVFLFRQLYASMPDELIESAKVDGATWPVILVRIVAPLSKAVSVSAGLVMFIYQWEVFLWPLIVANVPDLRTIQVALSLFQQEYQTFWDRMLAGVTISVLVPVLLILPLQRYYVLGISRTGLKE